MCAPHLSVTSRANFAAPLFEHRKEAAKTTRKAGEPDKQEWNMATPFHQGDGEDLCLLPVGQFVRVRDEGEGRGEAEYER